MADRYDVAVIGLGLFGAAALRHLTRLGARAIGIGPAEPESWIQHDGVFSSHYDSGRITRQIDRHREWADLAIRSISEYAPLAASTGIHFHRPVGTLWADANHARVREIESVARSLDIACAVGETSAPTVVHGYRLPSNVAYAYEPDPAGYIDPRRMLAAQLAAATSGGAAIHVDHVVAREHRAGGYLVKTEAGECIEAERVLLATGAYANAYGLPSRRLPLRIKSEVTLVTRVADAEAETYRDLPTLIYGLRHEELADFYLVPPSRYPNGALYLKAGADTAGDVTLRTREDMNEWMRTGFSGVYQGAFEDVLRAILPALPLDTTDTKRCLITYTTHGLPYIDEIGDSLFVVVGGNGRGAKSSDAIGRAAAALALGAWEDPLPRDSFRVPFASAEEPDATPL